MSSSSSGHRSFKLLRSRLIRVRVAFSYEKRKKMLLNGKKNRFAFCALKNFHRLKRQIIDDIKFIKSISSNTVKDLKRVYYLFEGTYN